MNIAVKLTLEKELDDLRNGLATWKLNVENDIKNIKYEHSDTLIDIFSNIQDQEALKDEFVVTLRNELVFSREERCMYSGRSEYYASTCAISFHVLVKLGFIDDALAGFKARKELGHYSATVFKLILDLLEEDITYFNLKQNLELLSIVKNQSTEGEIASLNKRAVITALGSLGYEVVKKSVKGINFEINKDKEEVKKIISYLDFDKKYNELLTEIDSFINTESSILSSGMIGNLRTFMADMLCDMAKKVAKKEKEEIPKYEKIGHMGNVRRYLKNKLELSDNDDGFINKFVDILHSEGGHSFVSNKQYFRLARNIGIEIALLLLSKYKDKYSK